MYYVRQVSAQTAILSRQKPQTSTIHRNCMSCECASLKDTVVVDMAHPGETMVTLAEIKSRGGEFWWLEVSQCSQCRTPWLVGHEERQNDVFVLRRLSEAEFRGILEGGVWPSYFDEYETLLRLGRDAGHTVRWVDPFGDSSLLSTITDLARQRPGIRVSELAELLDIDFETAATISEEASLSAGVSINLDDEPLE